MKIVDCRNMTCPAPVVTVKRALEEAEGETLQVLLDPGAPRENVSRFAASRGYVVEEAAADGGIALTISARGTAPSLASWKPPFCNERIMLVTSNRLGQGADNLGMLLMKNFIITLLDLDAVPDRMIFLNSGVFLTSEGSEVLEALEKLGNLGVEISSCGVCLDFFQLKEKLRAGSVTNMFTIAEALMKAGSVITL